MKKTLKRLISVAMAMVMLIVGSSMIVYAAEPNTQNILVHSNSSTVTYSTLYLNDWDNFDYGSSLKPLSATMPRGSYTISYIVSKPVTLLLWHDNYTQYSFELSGRGQKTIYIPAACSSWQCLSNYSDVEVDFLIYK